MHRILYDSPYGRHLIYVEHDANMVEYGDEYLVMAVDGTEHRIRKVDIVLIDKDI